MFSNPCLALLSRTLSSKFSSRRSRGWLHAGMAGAVLLAVVASTGIVRAQTGASSEIVKYEGTVVPAREAELAPRSDGLLEKIHFRPGQLVQKNDLLFEFMSTEKELQLEMERARLARAEAKLKLAEADLANKARLRKTDATSQFQLHQVQTNRDTMAADVAEARASVRLAEFQLKELKLYAPFDGIMSEPQFSEGTFLKRELKSRMARIIQLDPIRVAAEAPFEGYYERRLITTSDEATRQAIELTLILPNGVRYPHKGRLVSGGYQFGDKSQKMELWAEFPNPDHLLRPGLRVKLESRLSR